jgi:hypothetical protein
VLSFAILADRRSVALFALRAVGIQVNVFTRSVTPGALPATGEVITILASLTAAKHSGTAYLSLPTHSQLPAQPSLGCFAQHPFKLLDFAHDRARLRAQSCGRSFEVIQ